MNALNSLFVILSVVAAIFVPQVLVLLYATPRNSEADQHEFDYR